VLAELLEQGRINEALNFMLQSAGNVATASTAAFLAAAQSTAEQLGRTLGTITIDYDTVNQAAVNAMQQNRLELVRGFTTQQTRATHEAISSGIRDGLNPRQQALRFKNSIGLTAHQQRAVDNFERALRNNSRDAMGRALVGARDARSIAAAIKNNQPIPAARLQAMVDRYRTNMIAHRASVIARTEALRSVHEGSEAMLQQAIDDGTLEPDRIERHWFTAKDERVRSTHRTMHKQIRPVGVPFVSGSGALLMRPGDSRAPASETIQCRCRVAVTIKIPALEEAG